MIINIITGNRFSQRKLFLLTNQFFNKSNYKKIISSKDDDYIVEIGKKSVKIILSDNHTEQDINKVKTFIKTLFKNKSILISSSCVLPWTKEIETVKINTL